jgi:hypothetical protein
MSAFGTLDCGGDDHPSLAVVSAIALETGSLRSIAVEDMLFGIMR